MKRLLLLLALVSPALATPRLHVPNKSITPGVEIELLLDKPACPAERIGKEAATKWLKIEPAWPGKTIWKEANVLRFEPSSSPTIGTSYRFSLVGKHVHLDSTTVPNTQLGDYSTPAFDLEYSTILNRYDKNWSPRTASCFVRFNEAVDPIEAAPFLVFEAEGNKRIAAITTRASLDRIKHAGYISPTFSQRFDAGISGTAEERELSPDFQLTNGLIIKPSSPLPLGKKWRLAILSGLPGESSKLSTDRGRSIGDINAFEIQKLIPRVSANTPRRIVLDFTAKLPANVAPTLVEITPEVPGLKFEVHSDELHLTGDFSTQDDWFVKVSEGLTSYDGRPLTEKIAEKVIFSRLTPSLGLPSEDESQLASGSRKYRISTINLESLHVRVKKLTGPQLIRAQQGYRHYTGDGPNGDDLSPTSRLPYSLMEGETIADLEIPLDNPIDTSQLVVLDWDKILAGVEKPYQLGDADPSTDPAPAKANSAAFFLDVTGHPHAEITNSKIRKTPANQALIQLTDIGLAWKISDEESSVFAFSCLTGKPLPGVQIETFTEDAKALASFTTDPSGLTQIPRSEDSRHLRASLGNDEFSASYDDALPTVGLWRFPVRYSWSAPPISTRRLFLFTDRSLYRPSETVHIKGIVRQQNGNTIEAPGTEAPILTITSPTQQEILTRDIVLSPSGSFDVSFQLPAETTGYHRITVTWPTELEAAEELESWTERSQAIGNARFTRGLRVEEFRRNAFELTHDLSPPAPGDSKVELDLTATYYQGQAVAKGEGHAWTRILERNLYPERYRDFLFGDHRTPDFGYWMHYFGYRWGNDNGNRRSKSTSNELELGDDGKAHVTAELPEAPFPMARSVIIQTEVTDANHQTLTKTTSALVHPASVYAGIRRLDRLVRVGDKLPLEIITVTPDGKAFPNDIELTATLSREVNEQVRVQNAAGRGAVRNEARQEQLSTTQLKLSGGKGTEFLLAPEKTGRHTLEVRGTDPSGHAFATATTIHVYGTKEYPWAYEESMRIKLVPEKKLYQPGDTARVLVLSPIEGTALVTVERETVTRSFLIELNATDPVIEIPLNEDDAPNCYVSVLVIKGAQDSLRKHKEPQLRLGYCELTVENQRDRLAVSLEPVSSGDEAQDGKVPVSVPPSSEITVTGTVLLSNNKAAANAEITLYAEDEGTLAVAGYETPAPMPFFYNPRLLRVECGTSLGNFIPEDPNEQTFFNKGFFIGGGGGGSASALDNPRRDFNPCAFWEPALITDAKGRFTATVRIPDTLTRYRLIAVANHGTTRFGHAESSFTVSKDLMLEPQAPRFANESDTLDVQTMVTNASEYDGTWQVTFTPNPPASAPIAISAITTENRKEPQVLKQQINLAAGKSGTVSFPVAFKNTGEATFQWSAKPINLISSTQRQLSLTPALTRKLSDSVEASFQVEYPVPLLRQTQLIKLDRNSDPLDLLKNIDPALRTGRGQLELELSRSLLLEAGGAIDHLLNYPYGCLEQTTSSLIPWLAVEKLRSVSPTLAKHSEKKVSRAIQTGIDRLLSMQQRDGGFAYWPGSSDSLSWASSYAGLGLILASEQGNVPPASIEALTEFLIKDLRNAGDTTSAYQLETVARHLWVLAVAGKPQQAYVNKLKDRLTDLTPQSRCMLALAEQTAGNTDSARAILTNKTPFRGKDDSWMRWKPVHAYSLLAWSAVDPKAPEATDAIDRMLRDRNPYGHWQTTWSNAWSLIALSAYADAEENLEPTTVTWSSDSNSAEVVLKSTGSANSQRFPLTPGLSLNIRSDGPAYLRLKVAAKPEIAPIQPVANNGLEITRFYERVSNDGTSKPLDVPKVGDLIRVTLRVTLPEDDLRYLVVEDRLPSIFESVNNSFESQSAQPNAGATSENQWQISHTELRNDRTMFFLDRIWSRGTYTLKYLVRCTQAGQALAPPAKVESMYDPENTALSASRNFVTK